jgi:hypothetical protein
VGSGSDEVIYPLLLAAWSRTQPYLAVILRSAFRDEGSLFDFDRARGNTGGGPKTAATKPPPRYGKTVSVKLTLDVAPFGAVAVTTSG